MPSFRRSLCAFIAAHCWLVAVPNASADPFTATTTLTGDFRAGNPDNLFVNVTVSGDTSSSVLNWIVDIDSPLHADAVLDVFAFNLAVDPTQVVFGNFSPTSWSIVSPTTSVPGSGGASFYFESNDPPGRSNNVTNSVNLTFTSTLLSGTWDPLFLTNAPLSTGGGIPAPGAQLGAHLRSLSTSGCSGCSDSGFATGSWTPPTASVPEPSSLLLGAIGLLGAAAVRRRR